MPELIKPTVDLHSAFLAAHREWGPGLHEDGFGLQASDDVESSHGFASWVSQLNDEVTAESSPGIASLRCVYRWIVAGGEVLGGIALRHGDHEIIERIGHVGFGIRPSARRRGVATWALARIVEEARNVGLDRVLLVCLDDNLPSVRTIESRGGVLEGVVADDDVWVRRYWIPVTEVSSRAG